MVATIVLGFVARLDLWAGAKTILDSSRLVMETSGLAGSLSRKYRRAVWGCSISPGKSLMASSIWPLVQSVVCRKKPEIRSEALSLGPGEDVCKQRIVKILARSLGLQKRTLCVSHRSLPRFVVHNEGTLRTYTTIENK